MLFLQDNRSQCEMFNAVVQAPRVILEGKWQYLSAEAPGFSVNWFESCGLAKRGCSCAEMSIRLEQQVWYSVIIRGVLGKYGFPFQVQNNPELPQAQAGLF